MLIRDLPFEKAEIEVLHFEPWVQGAKDKSLAFVVEGKTFGIPSPYEWRNLNIKRGDVIAVTKTLETKSQKGKLVERGYLKFQNTFDVLDY